MDRGRAFAPPGKVKSKKIYNFADGLCSALLGRDLWMGIPFLIDAPRLFITAG